MSIDWNEINKALSPIKDYEDLSERLQVSFSYSFVRENFNFSMTELADYTQRLLGGDSRKRYEGYLSTLLSVLTELHQAGVQHILHLITNVETREQLEQFSEQSSVNALAIVSLLKYLVYWVIPTEKYLSGLIRDDPEARKTIKILQGVGIRTNLDLLQQGMTVIGRKALTETSGLSEAVILEMVNRADFSRMPWASKATVSNIMGAGFGSMTELADADAEKLYADFLNYGKSIGKNLKLGNEIENSYRITKIIPQLVQ